MCALCVCGERCSFRTGPKSTCNIYGTYIHHSTPRSVGPVNCSLTTVAANGSRIRAMPHTYNTHTHTTHNNIKCTWVLRGYPPALHSPSCLQSSTMQARYSIIYCVHWKEPIITWEQPKKKMCINQNEQHFSQFRKKNVFEFDFLNKSNYCHWAMNMNRTHIHTDTPT